MDRNAEFEFMAAFATESCFDDEVSQDQLRMLWTAYCLHYGLDVDTASYDSDLRKLWEVVAESEEETSEWSDFDDFDTFMCRYLV